MLQGVFHTRGESGGGGPDSREGLWPVPAELVQHHGATQVPPRCGRSVYLWCHLRGSLRRIPPANEGASRWGLGGEGHREGTPPIICPTCCDRRSPLAATGLRRPGWHRQGCGGSVLVSGPSCGPARCAKRSLDWTRLMLGLKLSPTFERIGSCTPVHQTNV
jgi:hypothetical protein